MKRRPRKVVFDLIAGGLCLDFVNTVNHRLSGQPEEKLSSYGDLLAFGEQTGVFSGAEARELRREARRNKDEASRVLQHALSVREMIFRILSAVAAARKPTEADVSELNAELRTMGSYSSIAPKNGKGVWRWAEKSGGAEKFINRILRSTVDMLTSDEIERVKECAAKTCGWLFIDRSRSRNRRWCEMRTCGSQSKARAYYQRKRARVDPNRP